jgi:hypothetical protein
VEITMQALYNACKVYEAEAPNLEESQVAKASGKEPLGGGVLVGITLTLVNGWRLKFEDRPGPTTIVADATGGNLVSQLEGPNAASPTFQNPIAPATFVTVTKTSSASATQSENEDIQYASYQNAVWFDQANGVPGTSFPIGTPRLPVNNAADAVSIAASRGFKIVQIRGDLTLGASATFAGFRFIGESTTQTTLTIEPAANVSACSFENAVVTGTLDGDSVLQRCIIQDLNYIEGEVIECLLEEGTITLGGTTEAHFLECWSGVPGTNTPVIDMGGDGPALALRGYSGGIRLQNKSGADPVSIDLESGQIILDNTITNGTIVVRGVGKLIDNSVGADVDSSGLIQPGSLLTKSSFLGLKDL